MDSLSFLILTKMKFGVQSNPLTDFFFFKNQVNLSIYHCDWSIWFLDQNRIITNACFQSLDVGSRPDKTTSTKGEPVSQGRGGAARRGRDGMDLFPSLLLWVNRDFCFSKSVSSSSSCSSTCQHPYSNCLPFPISMFQIPVLQWLLSSLHSVLLTPPSPDFPFLPSLLAGPTAAITGTGCLSAALQTVQWQPPWQLGLRVAYRSPLELGIQLTLCFRLPERACGFSKCSLTTSFVKHFSLSPSQLL